MQLKVNACAISSRNNPVREKSLDYSSRPENTRTGGQARRSRQPIIAKILAKKAKYSIRRKRPPRWVLWARRGALTAKGRGFGGVRRQSLPHPGRNVRPCIGIIGWLSENDGGLDALEFLA